MDVRDCRFCGSRIVKTFTAREREYGRCKVCRAVVRLVSAEAYEALCPQYDPGPLGNGMGSEALRTYLDVEGKVRLLRSRILRRGARVLDIGCGTGGYLLAARELGAEVRGIEPSREHVSVAREVLDLPVIHDYFRPGIVGEDKYDLVILSHVIEHIFEPRKFLETVAEVVAPGGRILLMTPNASSSIALLSGRHWVMLKPVDHVSLLAFETVPFLKLDRYGRVEVSQSEYAWEVVASLAAAARDGLQLGGRSPRGTTRCDASGGSARWTRRSAALRGAALAASWPVHRFNELTNRQACLVVDVHFSRPTS